MNSRSMNVADVEVVVRGEVPGHVVDYAKRKIVSLAGHLRDPILHARIRLTRHADPALARPVWARANLDVNGRFVRAEATGHTGEDAVDLLVDRLRSRLTRLKQR